MYNFYRDHDLYFRHASGKSKPSDFKVHFHDEYEILLFVSGNAGYTVETSAYPLNENSIIINRPNESHKLNLYESDFYERYTLNFSPDYLTSIDPDRRLMTPFDNRPIGRLNHYDASEFDISPRKLFAAMEKYMGDPALQRIMITVNLITLLGELFAAFNVKTQNETPKIRLPADDIADYINLHLCEELSLSALSSVFYLSSSQLSRQFKQATGLPIWEYITNKRLIKARGLIKCGSRIAQAASESGFNDYSSFFRLYVKKFGISPKDDADSKY